MRYLLIIILFAVPGYAMTYEQADIMPSQFDGQSITIDGGLRVHPNIEKQTYDFDDGTHGVKCYSDTVYSGYFTETKLNLLAGPNLSYTIVNSLSESDDYIDARITGNVEYHTTIRDKTAYVLWITKIELLDAEGEVTQELTDAEIKAQWEGLTGFWLPVRKAWKPRGISVTEPQGQMSLF